MTRVNVVAPCSPSLRRLSEAGIVLAILVAWLLFALWVTGGRRAVLFDTYRDMAWAINMCDGRIWSDPTTPHLPYWYAPGNPLLVAGLSRLIGVGVVDLYGYMSVWFNGLIPVALYVLVRRIWDRLTAVTALAAVLFGSYWWLTHVVANIPAIQGVVFNLLGLLCWHRCAGGGARARESGSENAPARPPTTRPPAHEARLEARATWRWPVITGLVLALSTWHHPLCGIVLAGAIFLHAAAEALASRRVAGWRVAGRSGLWRAMLIVAGVSFALTWPLIGHMLTLQAKNPQLLRFLASELIEPEFYAHAYTPLLVPAALGGAWLIARHQPAALWLVGYAGVGLLGQAAGYVADLPRWEVPYLLPHEFQWHGQLALGVCAAVGLAAGARAVARRVRGEGRRGVGAGLAALVLGVVVVGGGAFGLPGAGMYLLPLEGQLARTQEVREWILAHTTLDANFLCAPDVGYMVVAGLTGRKCVAVSPGHTNPLADAPQRQRDARTLLETEDPLEFERLARRYGATHLLLLFDSPQRVALVAARYASWSFMAPVFLSRDGRDVIFGIDLSADAVVPRLSGGAPSP